MKTTSWNVREAQVYEQWLAWAHMKIEDEDFDPAFIDLRQDTLIWT
jgi:hypothetical protein